LLSTGPERWKGHFFGYGTDAFGAATGEDGPTHQPVEHFAALRAIPNLLVFRPADANETAHAWKYALEHRDGPVALLLTRQGVPVIDQSKYASAANISRGAYILTSRGKPDVILLATGSEVAVALEAARMLEADGLSPQVVSMPCWKLFDKQDDKYKNSVIPRDVKVRVAVEAGIEMGWRKWLGDDGVFVGMTGFGASAPGKVCFKEFGITPENVANAARDLVKKLKQEG